MRRLRFRWVLPFTILGCGPGNLPLGVASDGAGSEASLTDGIESTFGAEAGGTGQASADDASTVAPQDDSTSADTDTADDGREAESSGDTDGEACPGAEDKPAVLDPAIAVGTSNDGTCSTHASGRVWCWGTTPGIASMSPQPALADAQQGLTGISGFAEAACGLNALGEVLCWGFNHTGQLGVGAGLHDEIDIPVVAVAARPESWLQVATGHHHVCARDTQGQVSCWGQMLALSNTLPDGVTHGSSTPIAATGVAGAVDLASGLGHACAVLGGGQVLCWGLGAGGELGSGSQPFAGLPTAVAGVDDAVAVGTRWTTTCIVHASGAVSCTNSTGLFEVDGMDDAQRVAVGDGHACALRACGRVSCWGDPSAIGSKGRVDRQSAIEVEGLDNAQTIAAGSTHTCVARSDGRVTCWGNNLSGQLGDGTLEPSITPVDAIVPER